MVRTHPQDEIMSEMFEGRHQNAIRIYGIETLLEFNHSMQLSRFYRDYSMIHPVLQKYREIYDEAYSFAIDLLGEDVIHDYVLGTELLWANDDTVSLTERIVVVTSIHPNDTTGRDNILAVTRSHMQNVIQLKSDDPRIALFQVIKMILMQSLVNPVNQQLESNEDHPTLGFIDAMIQLAEYTDSKRNPAPESTQKADEESTYEDSNIPVAKEMSDLQKMVQDFIGASQNRG